MVVIPADSGRSVVMCDHGRCGIGSDMSLPVGNDRGTLALAQVEQEVTNVCISFHAGPPISSTEEFHSALYCVVQCAVH